MRIGIHTGEVIAGITGTNVVRYDIYGPDVLIANKMESNGQAGKVNVSDVTKALLEAGNEGFEFSFNREVEAKAVSRKHQAYFVTGERRVKVLRNGSKLSPHVMTEKLLKQHESEESFRDDRLFTTVAHDNW
jgi:class 3 adenylate cyclase